MRLRLLLITLGALLVIITFTFPQWLPLLQGDPLAGGEAFPGLRAGLQADFGRLPTNQQQAYLALAADNPTRAIAMFEASLQPRVMAPEDEESRPSGLGGVIADGSLEAVDAIGPVIGEIRIFPRGDGAPLLRLENFTIVPGPDLLVYLSTHSNPSTPQELRFQDAEVEVGPLRATDGNHHYDLPETLDFQPIQSVVIYSAALDVIYATAPLFTR
ncbi:MAG: DM13 domain-containing protein [Chloroflexi bacterium]|nr:DM13 domain-containing protein [Chloroflexota bacterium]